MVDRVQPLKLEDPGTGGTETDQFTTALNPQADYVDARGVTLQNATSADDAVRSERDASDNMVFRDPVTGVKTLAQLAAAGSDEKVKVTANDTTAGYLNAKLTAGNAIVLTEQNDGADEDLNVAVYTRRANVLVTSALAFGGGPVDASGGGFTAGPDDVGDWLFMFEGWGHGSAGASKLRVGFSINSTSAFESGTERENEVSNLDAAQYVTTTVLTLADGDVVRALAQDIGSGTITLEQRHLTGVKLS